ncbi:MAG: hypothetical protein DCC68_17745 [Planctomycetota bacterium]|nr:MAG: hypothetical protein DCC68_17745 [Planctomycetota bacterium]
METGGELRLPNLVQTDGRTLFEIRVPSYALPKLETASKTLFDVGASNTLSTPLLTTMSGRGSGVTLADNAVFDAPTLVSMSSSTIALGNNALFDAPLLTSIGASGGGVTLGTAALLDVPELLSIDGANLSLGAGSTLNAPKLQTLSNTTYTREPNTTFMHGPVSDITGSELHVRNGATLLFPNVASYTNTLNDYRAHLTLLSADGVGSLLNLSGVQSFSSVHPTATKAAATAGVTA